MLLINGLKRHADGLHLEERWWEMGTKSGEQYFYHIEVFFIHQLMYKWIVLKTILKFTLKLTLKQFRNVSVQSHH